MKFLVIGSNSFSGASFVAHVLEAGGEVVGISRQPEPANVFLPYKWDKKGKFRFVEADLNHNLDRIMTVANNFEPEYVVNFAAQGMVAESWRNPQEWLMTNTVSMVNLHDRLRQCDYLKKYVQVSTPEVYGNTQGVIKESTEYHPSTPYAVSKAACDMSLMAFKDAYGFPVVFTRAANVCGPGQLLYRIVPRTIYCILAGEKLRLQGGGQSVRSFIHIKDVAEATLRAAQDATPGSIYHLSTDRRISIRELVELICTYMDVPFNKHVEVVDGRLGQDAAYLLDWTTAKDELGWEPKISLEEIVSETVDWMRDGWEQIKAQPKAYVHKP